jgi:uncharacterized membrane protein
MGMPEPGGSTTVTGPISIRVGIACTGLMLGWCLLLMCLIDMLFGGAIFRGSPSRSEPEPIVLLLSLATIALSLVALVVPPLLQAARERIFLRSPTNSL